MRVCINCQTENSVDAVFCSECGMSQLTRDASAKESEVQDTGDVSARKMRRIARVLALIWAACWTAWSALLSLFLYGWLPSPRAAPPLEWWLVLVFMLSVAWVPTAIAWRWAAIGGILLVGAGLLVFSLRFGWADWLHEDTVVGLSLQLMGTPFVPDVARLPFLAGLPFAAGSLFLASWRKSEAAARLLILARRRKGHAAAITVAVVCSVPLCLVALFLAIRQQSPGGHLLWCNSSPSISADGRYVTFASGASDLVPGDTNDTCDVFLHDRQTGETLRVSVASNGRQGNGDSFEPSVSADGRHVAFESAAAHLVPGDYDELPDIFVHDRHTGDTVRISRSYARVEQMSSGPSISADGRYVAFASCDGDVVPIDPYSDAAIFVHDRQTDATERVSVASDGAQGNDSSESPSTSADGRYVAFRSAATNLVPGARSHAEDIFVHDRHTGQTEHVSVASDGTKGNGSSDSPSVSADGRYVAFASEASNLVPGDTNRQEDVFVHDRHTGETARVSVTSHGNEGIGDSDEPSISADGRYVAFRSYASNLVPGDTNHNYDVFVHDRQTGDTVLVSVTSDGSQGNLGSGQPSISADGRYVAFRSSARNLVPDDTNQEEDVFIHDRETGETSRVSVGSDVSARD
jgi:Tol biopolymer transport system component